MKDPTIDCLLDRAIRAPLLVAASLRLAFMIVAFTRTGTRVMTQGDSASYLEPGRNLIFRGVFSTGGQLEIDRTPGYPIFAMITGMAFGNVLLTACAQIVLSLLSMLVLKRIADRLFPDGKIGTCAAWLYAIEPLSILYTMRLMPETLFVLLLLFAIERLLAFQSDGKLTDLSFCGILLAAATYVRPVSLYLGICLAAGLAIGVKPRSMSWKAPAVLLLSFLPWLAVWQIRNAAETGYDGFSSVVEKNLYFFQSAEVTAELQQIPLELEQERLGYKDETAYLAMHPEQTVWTRAERLGYMRGRSRQILAQHPWLYLKAHFKGVAIVVFSPCATEWLQILGAYPNADSMPHRIVDEGIVASIRRVPVAHPGVALVMAVLECFLLMLYFLAIWGCLKARQISLPVVTLIGVACYFLFISGGAQAVGRYRLPVMPIACIFAAAGITARGARDMRGRNGPAAEI